MYQLLFSKPLVQGLLSGRKTQTRRIAWVGDAIDPEHTLVTYGDAGHSGPGWYISDAEYPDEGSTFLRCPYGRIGDRLWVRETWRPLWASTGEIGTNYAEAQGEPGTQRLLRPPAEWRYPVAAKRGNVPAIFMPRWASRLTLEIESIRVERLQDITEADAQAEGLPPNWVDDLTGWDPADHGYLTPSGFRDVQRGDGRDCSEDLRASDGKPAYVFTAREAFALWWDQVSSPLTPRWAANPWVWVIAFKVVKL